MRIFGAITAFIVTDFFFPFKSYNERTGSKLGRTNLGVNGVYLGGIWNKEGIIFS